MKNKLVIAISSSALFDLEESQKICFEKGLKAYNEYQVTHETEVFKPGVSFNLAKKLLALNSHNKDYNVEVVLLSKNSADTGMRIFNSIEHHGLKITRAAFSNGNSPYQYMDSFGANLYVSADPKDITSALKEGVAAALAFPVITSKDNKLRVVFDGDATMFSDSIEKNERASSKSNFSLPGGMYKEFLRLFQSIQSEYSLENSPLRTALITSHSVPVHDQVMKTLRAWNIQIDEAIFIGDSPKDIFLDAFGADIVLDDKIGQTDLYTKNSHSKSGVFSLDNKQKKQA